MLSTFHFYLGTLICPILRHLDLAAHNVCTLLLLIIIMIFTWDFQYEDRILVQRVLFQVTMVLVLPFVYFHVILSLHAHFWNSLLSLLSFSLLMTDVTGVISSGKVAATPFLKSIPLQFSPSIL